MEFAVILAVLLLIVGGVFDFGHYLYLRQVATNASREGARYVSTFNTPRITEAQIRTYIQQKYGPSLGFDEGSGPTVTVTGAGGASGTDLVVMVTGKKNWFFLDCFISNLSNPDAFRKPAATTTMKLE